MSEEERDVAVDLLLNIIGYRAHFTQLPNLLQQVWSPGQAQTNQPLATHSSQLGPALAIPGRLERLAVPVQPLAMHSSQAPQLLAAPGQLCQPLATHSSASSSLVPPPPPPLPPPALPTGLRRPPPAKSIASSSLQPPPPARPAATVADPPQQVPPPPDVAGITSTPPHSLVGFLWNMHTSLSDHPQGVQLDTFEDVYLRCFGHKCPIYQFLKPKQTFLDTVKKIPHIVTVVEEEGNQTILKATQSRNCNMSQLIEVDMLYRAEIMAKNKSARSAKAKADAEAAATPPVLVGEILDLDQLTRGIASTRQHLTEAQQLSELAEQLGARPEPPPPLPTQQPQTPDNRVRILDLMPAAIGAGIQQVDIFTPSMPQMTAPMQQPSPPTLPQPQQPAPHVPAASQPPQLQPTEPTQQPSPPTLPQSQQQPESLWRAEGAAVLPPPAALQPPQMQPTEPKRQPSLPTSPRPQQQPQSMPMQPPQQHPKEPKQQPPPPTLPEPQPQSQSMPWAAALPPAVLAAPAIASPPQPTEPKPNQQPPPPTLPEPQPQPQSMPWAPALPPAVLVAVASPPQPTEPKQQPPPPTLPLRGAPALPPAVLGGQLLATEATEEFIGGQPLATEECSGGQPLAAEKPTGGQPLPTEEPAGGQPLATEECTGGQPLAPQKKSANFCAWETSSESESGDFDARHGCIVVGSKNDLTDEEAEARMTGSELEELERLRELRAIRRTHHAHKRIGAVAADRFRGPLGGPRRARQDSAATWLDFGDANSKDPDGSHMSCKRAKVACEDICYHARRRSTEFNEAAWPGFIDAMHKQALADRHEICNRIEQWWGFKCLTTHLPDVDGQGEQISDNKLWRVWSKSTRERSHGLRLGGHR